MVRKRFMVFAYGGFYPNGGMNDFVGFIDTQEELAELKKSIDYYDDFYQIYDTETNETRTFNLKNWKKVKVDEIKEINLTRKLDGETIKIEALQVNFIKSVAGEREVYMADDTKLVVIEEEKEIKRRMKEVG